MDWIAAVSPLVQGGFGNLAAYLAAHVLLCLLPAFFIAGAMTALIPKQAITRFLGRNTHKSVSYPAAAAAGSLLAVCSCTIVPIFAGIYRKGAGIGPAITFLFFAPAANILALVYTGGVIGADLAFARFFLSLAFGIGIGLLMALIFRSEDAAHDRATDTLFAAQDANGMSRAALGFLAGVGGPAARRNAQARLPHGRALLPESPRSPARTACNRDSTRSFPTMQRKGKKASRCMALS